ncbi:hypothetical protein DPMN_078499 [Dreissena polymorpha]|uniref:Uncharacterized protein n=1 Tax=Dreissena polymorpha TaxID=45954 RepID=A0A9D3YQM0_DREPO|nr:hypothetical protein DPMN_078499 [Dreissena polymorpha]
MHGRHQGLLWSNKCCNDHDDDHDDDRDDHVHEDDDERIKNDGTKGSKGYERY